MRIQFSDVYLGPAHRLLSLDILTDALAAEQAAGRIAPHVTFKVLRGIRSNTGRPAVEVQLQAAERDRGRRYGAAGAYSSRNEWEAGRLNYAATFDEWGWFLRRLYRADWGMVVGSPSRPTYSDGGDFDHRTGKTYRADLAELIERAGDPFPFRVGKNVIGARGRGRSSYGSDYWGQRDERTADWARAFYAGEVF
jgi:hypothetical protein